MITGYTLLEITVRSLAISGLATILASLWSIPMAILLSISQRRSAKIIITISNSLVGVPTVIIGLFLYLLLSRSGPLGMLSLLYTPLGIVIGQTLLITPLMISLGVEVVGIKARNLIEMLMTFGASTTQLLLTIFEETISNIVAVLILGFERALGELGIALMIGGNIRGFTRVFTTAIALEIQRGEFELAIYLGIILLLVDFIIIALVRVLGWRK